MSTKTITRDERVQHFHKTAGNLNADQGGEFITHLLTFSEELVEFNAALTTYINNPTPETRADMIKEWCDVEYTHNAFPWFFGFDGQTAFNRVCDNNETKIGPDGTVTRNEYGKILKPEGYVKVDMSGL